WVFLGLPISFMGMFIIGVWYGMTINVISLFGMIIVIGILVDDGIVISENIYQHYERGKSAFQAAVDGSLEVVAAVFTAILTTVIAFASFFFFEGRVGDFFKSMAFVVMTTLLFSLIEGFLILPAHVSHSRAMKGNFKDKKPPWLNRQMNAIMDGFKNNLYAPLLRFSMENKALTMAAFMGLFIFSIGLMSAGIVKFTFFPVIEQNNVQVSLRMPAGTREAITEDWLEHIEKATIQVNEKLREEHGGNSVIETININVGPTTYEGNVTLILAPAEKRLYRAIDIADKIRNTAGEIPNAEETVYGIISPFGKPISISLQSFNQTELRQATEMLKDGLRGIPALSDVVDTDQEGLKEVNITLKDKAYQLGLQVQDIVGQVRQGFFGEEVQRLQRGQDEVKVWVRYGEEDRTSIEQLEEMRIRVNEQSLPLRELANLEIGRGIVAINHLDTRREIRVEADLADSEASVTEIQGGIQTNVLPEILKRYPSVRYTFEGQSRESEKTGKSGAVVMPIVIAMMFFLVMITYRSIWQPVVIFILLIFGFIWVVFGHFIHGQPISMLSILGMVALIGVMINDSLVLVNAMNNYLKDGLPFKEAVYQAGLSRFRPIILTSATTIAGLAPLILEKSFQAQFLVPMAISLAYGLLVATFVTLLALPVMLIILNQAKILLTWLWEGNKPSPEMVEPAVKEMKVEQELEAETV
ncbi:MAG: efflux RND transporter permease subunit, partial [Bacteroidota bacterium]